MPTIVKKVGLPKGETITIRIPEELIKEFGRDLRIVVRHPWVVGIPVPDRFIRPQELRRFRKAYDLILTPKKMGR